MLSSLLCYSDQQGMYIVKRKFWPTLFVCFIINRGFSPDSEGPGRWCFTNKVAVGLMVPCRDNQWEQLIQQATPL